ncbi:MAG: CreA family protein, partial [Pollutimonas bauzanensis]
MKHLFAFIILSAASLLANSAHAEKIGCVSTTWRVVNNDKVCVQSFRDPEIDGVVCHVSYAQTGGISGALGFAEGAFSPGGLKVVAEWFPAKERGLAGGLYN